ncbi:MAG: resuscitation-promoting factor RpfB [Chloroflexota bacterium]|nr:resuscitation-promoting factor RpfB [Chloroflexota bacterium]
MAGTWSIAAPARSGTPPAVAVAGYERAAGLARFRPLTVLDPFTSVTVVVDGIALATDTQAEETVGGLLRSAGIDVQSGDRLSVPLDRPLVAGLRIELERGFPVTVVDGGSPIAMRAQPGSVAAFLGRSGIAVGPNDLLEVAAEGPVVPGAIIGIQRVTEATAVETIPVAAPVQTVADPSQYTGWRSVTVAGAAGSSKVTFLVRRVNGVETGRTIVATEELTAPVAQVVRVGTKVRPLPPPPAEIEALIRTAAAKYGVDPEQLLRVAYCESRYDPLAYNGILGASGLFQIIPGTWRANSAAAGYGGASVFDAFANANVAAFMFSKGQAYQWACK